MSTLLIRLAGPMQSWGTQSRFTIRDTGLEPSKSGVIGILCAAMGRLRSTPVDDLAALRMGVRVDREGIMKVDYHTAGGVHRRGEIYGVAHANGSRPSTVESRRYYLADADFLVGLEGDAAVLRSLDAALAQPRWQLFLGRKSFVPSVPIRLPDIPPWGPGLREESLEESLKAYPWPHDDTGSPDRLRLVLDAQGEITPEVRRDVPVSFADRQFQSRYVKTVFIEQPEGTV